jgi:hypothetical protein
MQGPRVIVDICYNREIITSGMAMGHHKLEQYFVQLLKMQGLGGGTGYLSLFQLEINIKGLKV